MLNFIICEDEDVLSNQYKTEINKFMMKYDMDYRYYIFKGYTKEWKRYAETDDGFKIYLLDIKTAKGSGIDAARMIREEFDDWTSMIIMITSYSEYRYEVLCKRLMLVDFINKLDNWEKHLKEALSICMKNYDKRPKTIKYTYKNVIYNVELRQILYIEKEPDTKRCIIKTNTDTFYIQGTINNILNKLDKRFVKCSRSMIINLEQVESYNTKNNILTFKNKEKIDAVSRDKRKEIVNHVRGIN